MSDWGRDSQNDVGAQVAEALLADRRRRRARAWLRGSIRRSSIAPGAHARDLHVGALDEAEGVVEFDRELLAAVARVDRAHGERGGRERRRAGRGREDPAHVSSPGAAGSGRSR